MTKEVKSNEIKLKTGKSYPTAYVILWMIYSAWLFSTCLNMVLNNITGNNVQKSD